MAANPFLIGQSARPGRETKESLEAYAVTLNLMRFVKASGKPYFVNKRTDEKKGVEHFLDRQI